MEGLYNHAICVYDTLNFIQDMTSDYPADEWKQSIAEMNKRIGNTSSGDIASAIHYMSRRQPQHQLGQIYNILDLFSSKERGIPHFPTLVGNFIREPKGIPATSEVHAECIFGSYFNGVVSSDKWEEGQ